MVLKIRILLIFIFAFIVISDTFIDHEGELNDIDAYELISIVVHDDNNQSQPTKQIEFIAFNQLYTIELTPNAKLIASNIRHTNGNPSNGQKLEQYFTHLTEPCHYFGKVLNSQQPSTVALSMCNKRGIRGTITAFNSTLIIKPAKYYLDIEYDRHHYHDITDPHLVYKYHDTSTIAQTHRRLTSSHINNVEMYILSDPIFTSYYVTKYPSNWYDQLISYFADKIHAVSAEYLNTDWGINIGTISVSLVEVEVAHEYNQKYKSLTPHASDTSCTDILRSDGDCRIDSDQYLEDFRQYITNFKNLSTFDNAQLWSKMSFNQNRDGLGFSGTVCQGAESSAIISTRYVGDVGAIAVSAHELGHNFGMLHDGASGAESCVVDDALMGSRPNGFSSCSIAALQDYFETHRRRMNCISNVARAFSSNYGSGEALPSPSPIINTTSAGSSVDWQCATIHDMDTDLFNGDWTLDSTYDPNDMRIYTLNSYYLYPVAGVANYWVISDVEGSDDWEVDIKAYALATRLIDCVSWIIRTENGWFKDVNAFVTDCASNTTDSIATTSIAASTTALPTATVDACIRSINMNFTDFNGVWSVIGTHEDHPLYQLNEYYLYYSLQNVEWVLSNINGSHNIDDILAYCRASSGEEVVNCAGWRIYDDVKYIYTLDADGVFVACDPWSCVGFSDMSKSILDGHWNQFSSLEGRNTYAFNGLYLYYAAERSDWIISRALGSREVDVIWGYCTQFDVSTCSHSWFILEDEFKADNDSLVYDCSDKGNETCTYYDCLSISQLTKDVDESDYNGDWYPRSCVNNEAYYTLEGSSYSRYLCYNSNEARWVITDELCEGTTYAYCPQADILDCGDFWFIYDGYNLVRDSNNLINDCEVEYPGGKGTDSKNEEFECQGIADYSSKLCIFSNGTLWTGWKDFAVNEFMCLNDKAVYHYSVKDINVILEGTLSYYLYWQKYYQGDNTIGDWVITLNKVSGNAQAKCDNVDLLGCTRGYWETSSVHEDTLMFKGGDISLVESSCDKFEVNTTDVGSEDNASESNTFKIGAIIMGSLLVIVLCVIAIVMRHKMHMVPNLARQAAHTLYMDSRGNRIALGMSQRPKITPGVRKIKSIQIVYEDEDSIEEDELELTPTP